MLNKLSIRETTINNKKCGRISACVHDASQGTVPSWHNISLLCVCLSEYNAAVLTCSTTKRAKNKTKKSSSPPQIHSRPSVVELSFFMTAKSCAKRTDVLK